MNYAQEKYTEANDMLSRNRYPTTQDWDRILAIFSTVPQVTLEEATEIHDRYLSTKNGMHNACGDFLDAVNAVLANTEPTVNPMEYPEAITYHYDLESLVCNLCGTVVRDEKKHTAFHER